MGGPDSLHVQNGEEKCFSTDSFYNKVTVESAFLLPIYRNAAALVFFYDATPPVLAFAIGGAIMPQVSGSLSLRSRIFYPVTPTLVFLLMIVLSVLSSHTLVSVPTYLATPPFYVVI